MFKLSLDGKLTLAQLPEGPLSVLDLGCGTGIWSSQFAASHPLAQVLGIDIVPPRSQAPSNLAFPSNCRFAEANIENDWNFAKSGSFDLVFARLLISALKDWKALFGRVYDILRPGGQFEVYEGIITFRAEDGTTAEDSAAMRWFDEFRSFVSSRGVNPDAPTMFLEPLKDCGFNVIYDQQRSLYTDPDTATTHQTVNGAEVAVQLTKNLHSMMLNITEKALNSDAQRRLCDMALEDLAQNSGRRGYHVIHRHMIVEKPNETK